MRVSQVLRNALARGDVFLCATHTFSHVQAAEGGCAPGLAGVQSPPGTMSWEQMTGSALETASNGLVLTDRGGYAPRHSAWLRAEGRQIGS